MSHVDFSSWPREQEQSFVVYEQRGAESAKKAWTFAVIVGAVVFLVALGIAVGVEPEVHDISKDMNMSNLSTSSSADK